MSTLSATTTNTPGPRASGAKAMDFERKLHASRRIDWQFLLPCPELGDVACLGRVDAALSDALETFGKSLTVVDGQHSIVCPAVGFDLVVAGNPNRHELRRAGELVRPGGCVYVEVCRRGSRDLRARRGAPRGPGSFLAAMRQLDLVDVQAHWHWPDFAACREIIPLADRAAVLFALRRRGSGFASRWKTRLARLLLESRLLPELVPCFSVLGRRSH